MPNFNKKSKELELYKVHQYHTSTHTRANRKQKMRD